MYGLHSISAGKFFAIWTPAIAIAAVTNTPAQAVNGIAIDIGAGITLPVVPAALGALGIVMSRPLARKSEAGNGFGSFLLVSLIMLVVVELWIIETAPSFLFAFVIAIGLGFSGYSLIELVSKELGTAAADMVSKAGLLLRAITSKMKGPKK